MTLLPAGISTPPTVVVFSASRKAPLIGLSSRSVSSMNRGISSRCSRSRCCSPGSSQISRRAVLSSRTVVSLPAENRFAAIRATSTGSGVEPSGNFARAMPVSTSPCGSLLSSSIRSLK